MNNCILEHCQSHGRAGTKSNNGNSNNNCVLLLLDKRLQAHLKCHHKVITRQLLATVLT